MRSEFGNCFGGLAHYLSRNVGAIVQRGRSKWRTRICLKRPKTLSFMIPRAWLRAFVLPLTVPANYHDTRH
jgi:hypothetical protein